MAKKPWTKSMPESQFRLMRDIIGAPSPIGFEASMTYGVIKPYFEQFALDGWKVHQFRGNAGIVLDTHPDAEDVLTVMIIGHADKIRMQVRSIGDDGKIWIDSDSFLPTTLIGHEVILFSEDPDEAGNDCRGLDVEHQFECCLEGYAAFGVGRHRTVERVAGAAAVSVQLLLDPAPAFLQGIPGQPDYVEGIHHRHSVG